MSVLQPNLKAERQFPWTMTHSFFAGMGGSVFDTDDPNDPPYIPGSPRLILTTQGVYKLAEHGHLPDVPEALIDDKSKADSVAKVLAVLQASWLLVQCIARWSAHLPLALLELNTLAHVVCALLMYILWVSKPYNIHEAIRLSGDWIRPICATMCRFSRVSTGIHREGCRLRIFAPEIERLVHADLKNLPSMLHISKREDLSQNTNDVRDTPGDDQTLVSHPPAGEDVELGIINVGRRLRAQISNPEVKGQGSGPFIDLSSGKASKSRYPSCHIRRIGRDQVFPETRFGPKQESVHYQVRNASWSCLPRYFKPPVEIEMTSTRLTRWALAASLLQQSGDFWDDYRRPYERVPQVAADCPVYEYPNDLLDKIFIDPDTHNFPHFGIEHPVLRQVSYLVVEAVISLRQAPVKVYETPRFVQCIPHI